MPIEQTTNTTIASAAYAALRHGGAPPEHARVQLGLRRPVALQIERCFLARKGARDERHIRAVLKAGGFPACRLRPR
jgi:hypothetical protein